LIPQHYHRSITNSITANTSKPPIPFTMSNPEAQAAQAAHIALLEQLDIHHTHKTFRNPSWRPNPRRNKNLKAILGDASRKEASVNATPQDNSGAATPAGQDNDGLSTSGTSTPAVSSASGTAYLQPNLAQASRSLSKLVLEKNMSAASSSGPKQFANGASAAPTATYTNIESAPSLAPLKHYCDVTGLPAPYLDPKTRLRYHNREVFAMIRNLPQGVAEQFLEARGAHTVLK
jgi:INO80 complex subunit C